MKSKHLFFREKGNSLLIVVAVLLFSACIDGYKDDWTFSSGVKGVTLESPKAEDVKFTPSDDGLSVTVSWPVVLGAGGYQFSLYIVDDPDNPVAVGEENETVDGCSVIRELQEDTKYRAMVKTLGSEKDNNIGASTAMAVEYNTLVDAALIPAGTDLTAYFGSEGEGGSYERGAAFELVGGAEYSMSGDINLGTKSIVIRGDRINPPKINVSGKFISSGAGLKLKFLNLDLKNKTNELINYSDPSAEFGSIDELKIQGSDKYAAYLPVIVDECTISGLTYRLLSTGSSKNFFIQSFMLKNCMIHSAMTSLFIQFSGKAWIQNVTMINSTFNNSKSANPGQRFMQYGNGDIAKSGCSAAYMTLTNNTFYNLAYSTNMCNYNMMRKNTYTITARRNIFVDCSNGEVIKGFSAGNNTAIRVCEQNAYWYNGAFPEKEITEAAGDKSGTHFSVDPNFTNSAEGDFRISASELIEKGIGDPRWLD